MKTRSSARAVVLAAALLLLFDDPAQAYIGPGAGFAVLSSFFAVFLAMATACLTL